MNKFSQFKIFSDVQFAVPETVKKTSFLEQTMLDALLIQITEFHEDNSFNEKIVIDSSKISSQERKIIEMLVWYKNYEIIDIDSSKIDVERYASLNKKAYQNLKNFKLQFEQNGIVVINNNADLRHFKSLIKDPSSGQDTKVNNTMVENFIAFLSTPKVLTDNTKCREVLFKKINNLAADDNIVITYIPNHSDWDEKFETYNTWNTYSKLQKINLNLLTKNFHTLKYNFFDSQFDWYIIKDKELAQEMGFGHMQVGQVKLLNKGNVWREHHCNERKAETRVCYNSLEKMH